MTIKDILKQVNSVSFIQVTADDGRTLLFIPAWAMALAVILLVLFLRGRRKEGRAMASITPTLSSHDWHFIPS